MYCPLKIYGFQRTVFFVYYVLKTATPAGQKSVCHRSFSSEIPTSSCSLGWPMYCRDSWSRCSISAISF